MKKRMLVKYLGLYSIALAPWVAFYFSFEAFLFLLGLKIGIVGTTVTIARYLK